MTEPQTAPAARDVLTQEEAQARAARVSDIHYDLRLDLHAGRETYAGEATITFELASAGGEGEGGAEPGAEHAPLFLDHTGKRIEQLVVNGHAVDAPDWSGYRLTLPAEHLQVRNTVTVVYEHAYDHTGNGFHQFIDPEDGEEYLYTNFEPYEAHRLFPCFDQPDLKATYALRVDAPAGWELIANYPERAREELPDGRLRRTFATTERFSTYLFALIAGPYEAYRSAHRVGDRDIPLGLFCRRSLVRHFDEEELFEVTRQGLDFFTEFFDYPYPFAKYDQVFVPEFNAGAMENVGAVTHSEHMVFRDPPTDTQRLGRAEVLLHEMAHMWFGNLVTMRWWNDLWLNESFATYMAYLAMAEATRFSASWQAFNAGMKNWAYRQDQLITTHPIAGEVRDTDETFLNFDGITYGKGASVIKQLVAAMGMEGFRSGMRGYFRRHAFGNTTLAQFLDALGEGVGRDLHGWADLWLGRPSLNTVAAEVSLERGAIATLALTQSAPPEHPTLRPHALEVALVSGTGAETAVTALAARIEGERAEVPGAAGRPAPDLVFPNHNDHGFVKVALDDRSIDYLREHLSDLPDPLLRQLIWQALWNMVRDQQLRAPDYLALAARHVRAERDPELIETILAHSQAAIGRYVPQNRREAEAHAFSEVAWAALQDAPAGDMQITWGRTLVGLALSREDIGRVARLADGELSVPGYTVDQDLRWEIAARCVAFGMHGAEERVSEELVRDPSDRGQRAKVRCEVSRPDADTKAQAWERFHGEGYGSLHLTAAAMGGFHWNIQRALTEPYVERFFEQAPAVFREQTNEFAQSYFRALYPGHIVEPQIIERAERLLAAIGAELPVLHRSLLEANDDLARAIACREFAQT